MSSENECPSCGADLQGDLIYEVFLEQGKTPEEAHESCEKYYGDPEHTHRFGRVWLLEDPDFYDGCCCYGCPECRFVWKRGDWVSDRQLEKMQSEFKV